MQKWEYKSCWTCPIEMQEAMKLYGDDGWECFAVIPSPSSNYSSRYDRQLFFKRPII